MDNKGSAPIYVGIFSLAALAAIFFLAVNTQLGESVGEARQLRIDFNKAAGLLEGANVRYQGVRIGIVDEIDLVEVEGELMARVTMSVETQYSVYQDVTARITAATLLGTQEVNLSGGTPEAGAATFETVIRGAEALTLSEAMEKLTQGVESVQDLADNLNENQGDLFAELKEMVEENREDIRTAVDSFSEAGPKFEATMANINEFSEKLAAGEGTLGKLMEDAELYEEVRKITDQIASGEGTMGKLIFSSEGHEELKTALTDIQAAFDEIKTVLDENRDQIASAMEGLADVGPTVKEAADDLRSISAKIEEGEGTLGKLVNDPGLYDEAKGAAEQLRETLEEAEEQTVLQSFFRIFTGGI